MELELTLDNFDAEIGKSTPILVDFWAAWCGPCRMLSGVIQQLANESDGSYRVGKVNVDEQPNLQSVSVLQASDGNPVQERRGGSETDGSCTQSSISEHASGSKVNSDFYRKSRLFGTLRMI